MTVVEIESIELLDFEYAIRCDVGNARPPQCPSPADYKCVLGCCGSTIFICEKCLEKKRQKPYLRHLKCGKDTMTFQEAFIYIERL